MLTYIELTNIILFMKNDDIRFRLEPSACDIHNTRAILESTGFFQGYEIEVAIELVVERLNKGVASGYNFIFAESAGARCALGFACYGLIPCTLNSYDLYWIAVHRDYQNLGLGKQLLKRSEEAAAAAGCGRMYIETSNKNLYQSTRAFYEKCGYIQEAVLKDFYAPGDDKVIFARRINN